MHDARTSSPLSTLNEWMVYLGMILIPLVFAPFLENVFDTPKFLVILIMTVIAMVSWSLQVFKSKEFSLKGNSFFVPLMLMMSSVLISAFFSPIFIFEDLSGLVGTLFFLSLWVVIGSSVIKRIQASSFLEITFSIGIILSIISFLQAFKIGPTLILNQLFAVKFADGFGFSPTGSPLIALTYLIPVSIAAIVHIMNSPKWQEKVFEMVATFIMVLAIGVHVFQLLPGKELSPILLPFQSNWVIAVENFKSMRSMFAGTGPNGFSDAFTKNRPVELNSTKLWNVIFQVGSNTPLYLSVTIGVIGLIAWFFLIAQSLRLYASTPKPLKAVAVLVLSSLLIQLVLPPNAVLLSLQFMATIVWIVSLQMHEHPSVKEMIFQFASLRIMQENNKEFSLSTIISYAVGISVIIVSAFLIFFFGSNTIAESFFNKALIAIQANKGSEAYQAERQAIQFNRYRDSYHRSYAQINFALANTLSQKKDPTDDDRKQVAQLMQQAVREARYSAQLNPIRSQNWRSMAEIYRSLIGSVDQADQFTLATYGQAIQFSPNDPTIRLDLGSLFMQQKNNEQAALFFEQAVRLKPDYANAYYNWGKSLELQKKWEPAVAAYTQTLRLIEANPDASVTEEQKATLKKELANAQTELDKLIVAAKAQAEKNKPVAPIATPTPTPEPVSETPQKVENTVQTGNEEKLLNTQPEVQPQPTKTP